jgi:hypothetical protein
MPKCVEAFSQMPRQVLLVEGACGLPQAAVV